MAENEIVDENEVVEPDETVGEEIAVAAGTTVLTIVAVVLALAGIASMVGGSYYAGQHGNGVGMAVTFGVMGAVLLAGAFLAYRSAQRVIE